MPSSSVALIRCSSSSNRFCNSAGSAGAVLPASCSAFSASLSSTFCAIRASIDAFVKTGSRPGIREVLSAARYVLVGRNPNVLLLGSAARLGGSARRMPVFCVVLGTRGAGLRVSEYTEKALTGFSPFFFSASARLALATAARGRSGCRAIVAPPTLLVAAKGLTAVLYIGSFSTSAISIFLVRLAKFKELIVSRWYARTGARLRIMTVRPLFCPSDKIRVILDSR